MLSNQPASQVDWGNFRRKLAATGLLLLELIKIAVLAGVTIIAVRYFLFKPFYVKGASMEPNFYDHEYLIIDEITYRFRTPWRGEVIVFHYPDNPKEYFLKRIVGLPGERIRVADGHLTIYNAAYPEGVVVEESYLPETVATAGEEVVGLAEDEYFVLGDNRPNSFDSRRFGPVERGAIVGRAWFRGWPLKRLQTFAVPAFNF